MGMSLLQDIREDSTLYQRSRIVRIFNSQNIERIAHGFLETRTQISVLRLVERNEVQITTNISVISCKAPES